MPKRKPWSVEDIVGLKQTRQLDLFVWGDAYDRGRQDAIRRWVHRPHPPRPEMPPRGCSRFEWDAWLRESDRYDRDDDEWAQRMDREAVARAERETLGHGIPSWGTLRRLVYERDDGTCQVCGREVDWDYYELGHLVDRMMGGADHPENVVVMCAFCNRLQKPLHETLADARAWMAACRRHHDAIRAQGPPPSDAELWTGLMKLSDDERERLVLEALSWGDRIEAARVAQTNSGEERPVK